jgi:6-phosphogluconolactonase
MGVGFPFPFFLMKYRFLSSILAAGVMASASPATAASDQFVYVGTYTNSKNARVESKGIYLFGLDSKTGKLEPLGVAAEVKSPSFLAISPDKKFVYSVSELAGASGGAISAFSVDAATGKLTQLNQQPTVGGGPCHVSVDPTGKAVMAANYGGGSVISYPVKADGSLGEKGSFIQHTGASNANPKRQKDPHAHSINVDQAGKFAFAADLGCDKVFIYKLDAAAGTLTPNEPAFAEVPPAGGPRHFAFHPSGKFAYVCNEMTCTVTAFSYDADKGALTALETLSTLPAGVAVDPKFSTAETAVHPSGKFVYVSNRGHDTIAIFKVDPATGKLTYVENAPAGVNIPRNFGIDPTGKWLISAGQNSSTITVFGINPETGKLKPTGQTFDVGAPVCVRFLQK